MPGSPSGLFSCPKDSMPRVTVYTLPVCPQCVRTKKLLEREGIEYDVVDLETARAADENVKAGGPPPAPLGGGGKRRPPLERFPPRSDYGAGPWPGGRVIPAPPGRARPASRACRTAGGGFGRGGW